MFWMGLVQKPLSMLIFLCLALTVPQTTQSSGFQDSTCHASFLQFALEIGNASASSSSSNDTASESSNFTAEQERFRSLLQKASDECPQSTEQCLSSLTDLRLAVWPHVQEETGWSGPAWLPSGLDSEQATGDVGCSEYKTMYYRHIWKSAGHSVFENLEQISSNFRQEGLSYSEFCAAFHTADSKQHVAFTFVRDPISRFISGYAEIEQRTRAGNSQYADLAVALSKYSVGSPERAAAFFQEFLRSGVNRDGHVKPQLEFMLPAGGCSIPMQFIGKTEAMEEDWNRLFDGAEFECLSAFNASLGLHPNDQRDKRAMEISLGLANVTSTAKTASPFLLEVSADMHAIAITLRRNGARYLRALCWLLLADFAAFNFELPLDCQHVQLQNGTLAVVSSTLNRTGSV